MSPEGVPRRPKGNPGGRTGSRSGPRGAQRCPRAGFGGPFGSSCGPRELRKRSSRFNESSIFAFHPTTVPGRPGSAPDPIIPIRVTSGRSPLGYPLDLRRGYRYPSQAPARRTLGVGGFRWPAATCRRPPRRTVHMQTRRFRRAAPSSRLTPRGASMVESIPT